MKRLKCFALIFFMLWPLASWAEVNAPEPQQSLKLQFERAMWLMQQQQWSAAAKVFNELLEQKSPWVEVQNNLAVALLKSGDIDAARQSLEQAVTALPAFKIAQQNRQQLYDYLAANAYDQALGNKTERPVPVLNLLSWQDEKTIERPENNDRDSIQRQITKWADAWSAGDVENYFSAYSKKFQPQKNIAGSYDEWRRARYIKLKRTDKPVIGIDNKQIFLNPEQGSAIAEFVQHYRAEHYADTVIKQLYFILQNGVWLIQSERVLEQLNP